MCVTLLEVFLQLNLALFNAFLPFAVPNLILFLLIFFFHFRHFRVLLFHFVLCLWEFHLDLFKSIFHVSPTHLFMLSFIFLDSSKKILSIHSTICIISESGSIGGFILIMDFISLVF